MRLSLGVVFALFFLLTGCVQPIPKDAFALSASSLEDRQMQSRKFDTVERKMLLISGASVLQDMGYALDESNAKLGVITASKHADAMYGSQIAAAVFIALLGGQPPPLDKEQKIRICLVVNDHLQDKKSSLARITVQRIIWNTQGQVSRVETIKDPLVYQEFFEKLSKSVFLEAHHL